ncbi:MAG: transporter substrate-binding domain-containing protein [Oscillospiraceae bacterium]|nr:transporter substrate-binding domain-containing protein [Oscillospiraceae bacterium]
MKKIIALLLALTMVFALAACGSKAEPKNDLEKIKAEGVLTVALSPDFSPMEFVDSSKEGQEQYVGFDVTLANYIAQELGVKLEIQAMSFDACQTAVSTGAVPMSISGYSWTETRAENYELSDYYYAGENETEQVLLIRAGEEDKYNSADDFSGVIVGAQNASLQQEYVTKQLPDAKLQTIGDIGVGVMELQAGNIEALAVAIGNGKQIIANNPDLVICEWQFEVAAENEANVVMMHKGQVELLAAVNAALAKAYDAGYYGEWYEAALELAASESAIEVSVED